MAESDFKVTVIGAINEVRKKSKLSPVATVDEDSDSILKLHYLNDVIADLSDHANWQELYREAIVSVQASVRDYAVSGVVVQNIHEVALSNRSSPLKMLDIDGIRQLQRNNSVGTPNQWCIKGVTSEGNPIITMDRWPSSTDTGYFNIGYYLKPSVYTTADASATVPFPGRVVVQGLLVKTILDESDGDPGQRYATNLEIYEDMKQQSYNRLNGDSGGDIKFCPARHNR